MLCTCIKVGEGDAIVVTLAFIDVEVAVVWLTEAKEVIDTIMALSIFIALSFLCFALLGIGLLGFTSFHVMSTRILLSGPAAFSSFTIVKHYSISSSMSAPPLARSLMFIHT